MYEDTIDLEPIKDLVPEPAGYRILIATPKIEEKTEGGIYRPEEMKDKEHTASIIGMVVKVGKDAYADERKFPNGAWCKEGDWVLFRSYAGIRLRVAETEFRLVNDDTIEGVVSDPRSIKRAY